MPKFRRLRSLNILLLFSLQRSNFRQFSPVFPLAGLGVVPDPNVYRVAVGVTEVVCAVLLYLGEKRVSYMVSWVIVGLMVGALYTHYALHHPLHMMTAATVCLLLAVVRILAMTDKNSIKVKIG